MPRSFSDCFSAILDASFTPKEATWIFPLFWLFTYSYVYRGLRNSLLNLEILKVLPPEKRTMPELLRKIGSCRLLPQNLIRVPDYTAPDYDKDKDRFFTNFFLRVKDMCWLEKNTAGKLYLTGIGLLHMMLWLYLPFLVLALLGSPLPLQILSGVIFKATIILWPLEILCTIAESKFALRDIVTEVWYKNPRHKKKRDPKKKKHGRQ